MIQPMDQSPTLCENTEKFIQRWHGVTASELATAQSFVIDLCELLGVDKPHATAEQDYYLCVSKHTAPNSAQERQLHVFISTVLKEEFPHIKVKA